MKLQTQDGEIYAGESNYDIVSNMHKASLVFTGDKTVEEYMQGFARRAKLTSDRPIRTDTADHFVSDALEFGLLKAV